MSDVVKFKVGIVNDLLRGFALIFGLFWLLKWWDPNFAPETFSTSVHSFAFLDSFLFTALTVFLLDPDRAAGFLDRVKFTGPRVILIQFAGAILFGALFLLLPISVNPQQKLSVIDALFLSVSALSVTGLSPINISLVLSKFGLTVLLILIQLGGLGVIFLTIGIGAVINRKLSIDQMRLSQSAFENCFVGDASQFLSKVVMLTFLIESMGAAWIYFSLPTDLQDRYFVAIFHAISAFCNAGFSTMSSNLADPAFSNFGIGAICVLIVLGGIGFPVMNEILFRIRNGGLKWSFLSPQTKVVLSYTAGLLGLGFFVFLFFQVSQSNQILASGESIRQAIFYSISSRTAGFNLIPVEQFSVSIQFLLILLMFVGASPSSTGGGVKTSTIAVLLATIRSTITQREQTVLFSRSVSEAVVQKSITVVMIYVLTAGIGLLLLAATESIHFLSLVFESFSALSTVGLSTGATSKLSVFGKVIIIFFMIFGRVGLLSIVNAGIGDPKKSRLHFPKENFYVG